MTKKWQGHGISLKNLDAKFAEDEIAKSNLILEGRMLMQQGKTQEGADRFAQAAIIEEDLYDRALRAGNKEVAWIDGFSAAGSWARAGNIYQAIICCDRLLGQPDLPDRLRKAVDKFSSSLHACQSKWLAELSENAEEELEPAGAEGASKKT